MRGGAGGKLRGSWTGSCRAADLRRQSWDVAWQLAAYAVPRVMCRQSVGDPHGRTCLRAAQSTSWSLHSQPFASCAASHLKAVHWWGKRNRLQGGLGDSCTISGSTANLSHWVLAVVRATTLDPSPYHLFTSLSSLPTLSLPPGHFGGLPGGDPRPHIHRHARRRAPGAPLSA